MAEKCSVCGKKFGAMLGVRENTQLQQDILRILGVNDDAICLDCSTKTIESEENKLIDYRKVKHEELQGVINLIANIIPIMTTQHPESWNAEIMGIVSGYSVIGTGPIVTIAASFTDLFGKESVAYQKKIKTGESNAVMVAKIQAIECGANAISGCSISITEATSGHGMIMCSCVGTAIKTDKISNELNDLVHKYKEIKREVDEANNKLQRLRPEE
jgi:uncharacterized protein YbjQ (UPF0145 family)